MTASSCVNHSCPTNGATRKLQMHSAEDGLLAPQKPASMNSSVTGRTEQRNSRSPRPVDYLPVLLQLLALAVSKKLNFCKYPVKYLVEAALACVRGVLFAARWQRQAGLRGTPQGARDAADASAFAARLRRRLPHPRLPPVLRSCVQALGCVSCSRKPGHRHKASFSGPREFCSHNFSTACTSAWCLSCRTCSSQRSHC